MIEVSADELRQAVEHLHACRASFREVVPVSETFQGAMVWEGIIHVFKVEGIPSVDTCYAWSSYVDDTERRKFYAVLQQAPIHTPYDAVRVAIVQDHKDQVGDAGVS